MDKVDLKLLAATLKHPKETPFTHYSSPSPSPVDPDVSSVSSIPSQLSDSGGRSQRNCHPPKILQPQPEIAQYDGTFNGLLMTASRCKPSSTGPRTLLSNQRILKALSDTSRELGPRIDFENKFDQRVVTVSLYPQCGACSVILEN
jgi:hypothetical protein